MSELVMKSELPSGPIKIGIVGATGAVGIEIVSVLHKRKFPVESISLYASGRSAGKISSTLFGDIVIEEFSVEKARSCHVVFLAVSGDFALQYAKLLVEGDGPVVIDNSSAFRYMDDVPLIIPEVNASAIGSSKLIANPNCTTAIASVVLWPIHCQYRIKKLIVSTYQAASGAGAEGMEELKTGTEIKLQNPSLSPPHSVFVHPLPFNIIPHIDKFQSNAYTKEEMKVVWETRKIFGLTEEDIKISCTAVRIPTFRAHAEAISIETECPVTAEAVRELLSHTPGVRLVDDPVNNLYPMPLTATSEFDVEVGRIRKSLVFQPNGLELFVAGDQLLRGAALNAVLIAEKMIPA